jgi:hypothetical protein
MRQITVEPSLEQVFGDFSDQVALCDANGRVIGFFVPLKERPRIEDLQLEPLLSIAETESLRQQNRTGKPLEEILGRLGF